MPQAGDKTRRLSCSHMQRESRVIDVWWKVALYDQMNFFLYLLLGGEKGFRARIIDYAQMVEGATFLDIGCATGGNVLAVLESVPFKTSVYGLDAAFNIIRLAKDKADKGALECGFIQAFAEKLPLKDNSVDRIVNVFMLHHLRMPVKIAVLKEMHRVLKKGGVMVVVDPTRPYNMLGRFLCFTRRYVPEIKESVTVHLEELVRQAGFLQAEVLKKALGFLSFVRARKA